MKILEKILEWLFHRHFWRVLSYKHITYETWRDTYKNTISRRPVTLVVYRCRDCGDVMGREYNGFLDFELEDKQ